MENQNQNKDLIQIIKDWVKNDNEIRELQRQQNIRKLEKKNLSVELMKIMKQNVIDSVELKDGQIQYTKRNVKKPITKKVLFQILSTYYKDDESKAVELNNYILDNREEQVKEVITRKIHIPTTPDSV
jgi:hypothetical protein